MIELEKSRCYENSAEENYTIRFQSAMKLRELENENKNLLNEKNKYEVDFKVISERYNELKTKYENGENELTFFKNKQNDVKII